jgi:hypothetical protein
MQTGLARTLGYAEARHASRGHQLNQARPTLPLDRDRGNLSIWFHSRSLSVHAAAPVSRRVHAPKQEEVRPWCSCGVRTVLPDNARIAAPSLTPLFAFLRVPVLNHRYDVALVYQDYLVLALSPWTFCNRVISGSVKENRAPTSPLGSEHDHHQQHTWISISTRTEIC